MSVCPVRSNGAAGNASDEDRCWYEGGPCDPPLLICTQKPYHPSSLGASGASGLQSIRDDLDASMAQREAEEKSKAHHDHHQRHREHQQKQKDMSNEFRARLNQALSSKL